MNEKQSLDSNAADVSRKVPKKALREGILGIVIGVVVLAYPYFEVFIRKTDELGSLKVIFYVGGAVAIFRGIYSIIRAITERS